MKEEIDCFLGSLIFALVRHAVDGNDRYGAFFLFSLLVHVRFLWGQILPENHPLAADYQRFFTS
jgi:hypothetical protein